MPENRGYDSYYVVRPDVIDGRLHLWEIKAKPHGSKLKATGMVSVFSYATVFDPAKVSLTPEGALGAYRDRLKRRLANIKRELAECQKDISECPQTADVLTKCLAVRE